MTRRAEDRCTQCGIPRIDHRPERCEYCGRPFEHHRPGDVEAEKAGRLRMAEARLAAGVRLDSVDRNVLAEAGLLEAAA